MRASTISPFSRTGSARTRLRRYWPSPRRIRNSSVTGSPLAADAVGPVAGVLLALYPSAIFFVERFQSIYRIEAEARTRALTAACERAETFLRTWQETLPFGRPLAWRIGRQILNWGESTFIQNGLNAILAANANRAGVPGAEVSIWIREQTIACGRRHIGRRQRSCKRLRFARVHDHIFTRQQKQQGLVDPGHGDRIRLVSECLEEVPDFLYLAKRPSKS